MKTTTGRAEHPTIAEALGFTEELARAAAAVAAGELQRGRVGGARDILEGLAVLNPHDPVPWVMLADLDRRRGRLLSARVCVEVARKLSPTDPQVRLARAQIMLADPEWRPRAREELTSLGSAEAGVGARARALLAALGP